jgi:hypothetical protein
MAIIRRDPVSTLIVGEAEVVQSKRTTASVRRMLTLTIADQGASSISNFALALLVAHYSDARQLGIFALIATTYILGQGLVRSVTSDCLLTRPETDDGVMTQYERAGYLTAFVVSTVLALGLLAVSGLLSTAYAAPLAIFAASFPLMALQDFSRFIGISRHDPAYAIRLDVAWLLLFLVAFVILRSMNLVSLPWLFGAWTGAGAVVGLTTLRSHVGTGFRQLLSFWIRSERAVGIRFAGQFMLFSCWGNLIFYLLVIVVSIDAVGEIKLALLALGPITVLYSGLQSALISLASKKFREDKQRALRFLLIAGLATSLAVAIWTALVYFAPVHLVTSAVGPTWPKARELVPYLGLASIFGGVLGAANAGLRSLRAAKENLQLALAMLPVLFVPCIGGAALWGAHGYAICGSVAIGINALVGWIVLVRVAGRLDPCGVVSRSGQFGHAV